MKSKKKLATGVIPVTHDQFDKLYPQYEKAIARMRTDRPTFQEWLRKRPRKAKRRVP